MKNQYNINGNKEGIWEQYDYSGKLQSKGNYVNGMEDGLWEFYEEGRVLYTRRYKNGRELGIWGYISRMMDNVINDSTWVI
jgi:antitoxin component YwqK of YwqJK toxin-antitoxin module